MRKLLIVAAVFALSLFWACHLSPADAEDHFDVIGDSTWTTCDTVLVELVDKDGKTVDTLFNDVLLAISQLKNLSAAKYDGSKAALVITGKKAGGLCFEEKRSFEGDGASLVIDTIKSTSAKVLSVSVDPETLSVPLGGSPVAVKASALPAYADQTMLWSLAGDGVVSLILPTGGDGTQVKLKPEKIGATMVTVRSVKDAAITAQLLVNVTAPSGIEINLDRDSLLLYVGGGMDSLKATILPASASQKVEWKSLDPSVATIDSLGRIKPVGVGDIFVVAKSVASGIPASARVIVKRDVPKLTVASKTGAPVNTNITFSPKVIQDYGSIVMYKWDLDGNDTWDDSIANPGVGLSLDLAPQTTKYSKEGSYIAKFMVRDGEGNEALANVPLDIGNQAPEILAIRADADISIQDSIAMTAKVHDVDGKVAWCGWDYEGDGIYDDSLITADSSVEVVLGHRYPDAGLFLAVFKAKDESGKTRLDTVHVKVELDRPVANLGNDTTVTVGSQILIHAKGTDKFGKIEKRELLIQGAGAAFHLLSKEDTTLTAPTDPGPFTVLLRVTDDDGLTDMDTLNVTVILSANADLSNLVFSAGPLDPVFKSSISFFSAHANYVDSTVTVTPTAKDASAKISVNAKPVASGSASDPVKIAVGSNINAFQIVVTAADGTQRVYSLSIARDPSADASLSKLDVTGFILHPSFAANIVDYSDTVASTVASVTLKPTLAVATASLTVNDSAMASGTATFPMPLAIGENLFKINVTSQSGLIKTVYQIKVVRRVQLVLLRSLGGKPATQTDSSEVAPGAPRTVLSPPATGYHFVKWTLLEGTAVFSDTAANPAALTLKSPKVRAQAEFVINKYAITAGSNAGGSISPSGIISVDHGQNQIFTIAATAGNRLKSAAVDGSDATAAIAGGAYTFFNVTSDHSIGAVFVKLDTITTKVGAGGNITPDKAIVDEGSDTTITITPNAGFKIAAFLVDEKDAFKDLVGNKYTFTKISGNHFVQVSFVQGFTLIGVAGPGGTITPTSVGVNKGDNQVFTVTAAANYRTKGLLDNGKDVFGSIVGGQYTINAVDTVHTVVAVFIRRFPITVDISGNGVGTADPSVIVDSLAGATLNFKASIGNRLTSLKADGVDVANTGSFTFSSVTIPHTLSIVFTKVTYDLTGKIGLGKGTIAPAALTVDSNANQTFTFGPSANYRFHHLSDNGKTMDVSATPGQYALNQIKLTHDIVVFYWRQWNITSVDNGEGKISIPTPLVDSTSVTTSTVTVTPRSGYRVVSVLDNGTPVATSGFSPYSDQSFTLSNITGDHQISAIFKRYFTVTASTTDPATGSITPASSLVDSLSGVSLTITPAAGTAYQLSSLLDNDKPVLASGNLYTLSNVVEDHKVVATFNTVAHFNLTVGDSANGLTKDQTSGHAKVCVTIVKSGAQTCDVAPLTLSLEGGTEYIVEAAKEITYSDCSGIRCNPTSAGFAEWVLVTSKGGATVLDQPNPTNVQSLKANISMKAVYSNAF